MSTDTPPAVDDVAVPTATPVIQAVGLSAGYGSQPVIHDIDLDVHAGEVVALIGSNGAGKTTTLLALSGELPALSGQVLMDGVVT